MKIPLVFVAGLVCLVTPILTRAQSSVEANPGYRINVVSRTTPAVKYEHRSGATKIDFRGTRLMPAASGEAKVESKRGAIEIEVEFKGLDKPTSFGTEYLTYVLWAISPEGRSSNVGEVLLGNTHRSKLDVTTDLQAFALIVTAEPYYAVRRPSNVVIMENVVRLDTAGTPEAVEAKYELIDRGGYIPAGYQLDPIVLTSKLPLEYFEAANAVRIAKAAGADRYAAPSYEKATDQLKRAEYLGTRKNVNKRELISVSRQVVQTADDAREIGLKAIDAARQDSARATEAAKLAHAQADSRSEMEARMAAERDTADANRSRAESDKVAFEALRQQQNALAESDRNQAALIAANQMAAQAQFAQQIAAAEAERNRTAAAASEQRLQQAMQDSRELRAKLLQQFNIIFATRDTARGLIVSLSDVVFDTGKSTLQPGAREKLAKISGIVLAYPDLRLSIEGNTDSVGSDAMNQQLSVQRAAAVRDYLANENVPVSSMTSQGFGETQPVASNTTAQGRQQNRRVELVVSGEIIGTTIGTVSQTLPVTPRP